MKLKTVLMLTLVIGASSGVLGCVKGAVAYREAPNETMILTDQLYDQSEGPAQFIR